ncbi:nitrate reductase [Aurantiacibacter gilvus]|uniref:Nitrate reductase n=1 Tax=Aurantiacibacter gilvus TaxID=3139141 RepID=A0ABU9IB59_9SPHN
MPAIRTTCAYCGVGCGIAAQVTGERSVTIKGDKRHPANHGRLCSKGTYLGETVGLEGRLLHPMIGDRQVSWNAALDEVAGRMRAVIAEHGPEAVAFYVSGQLLTEDYYVANKLAKGFVGTGNIDTNSRLCMASAVAAHNRAFGEDVVPCSYADLDCADLVILVGSNTAWCHPVAWQRIEAAREKCGTKLVVIDPRRTETAAMADLHIPVSPDGDVALFNALLDAVAKRGGLDAQFMRDQCDVPDGFLQALSGDHGIDPELFARLVDLVIEHPRTVTLFSQGANQSVCGTDKGNAIINFHLATGRINRPGAGPFSITGQPNAMGGREVGGLANMLACHLGFSEAEREAVADFWQAPNLCAGPGLKAVDLYRALHAGRIKFLWVMATNPAVSMPDAGFVREALARCPNVIVSDVIADTDTGSFADVRLPALAWGEKDGTVTNSERTISRQRALFAAPGEARADWQIICDVAGRLGYGSDFGFQNPAAVFREYAAMTRLPAQAGKALDLTPWADCSDVDYDTMAPFQWGGRDVFKDGFSTPNGRGRLIAVKPWTGNRHGLVLNTGRYRDQWHTMTRTGLSASLSKHRREPLLEVSPGDAERIGVPDGGFARLRSAQGESIFRVAVSDGQSQGELFAPMHFTDQNAGGGRTGLVVHAATDPVSGQPGFKNSAVELVPYLPDWRAFLLTRKPVRPDCSYWARARIAGGWLTELAGDGTIDVDALLPGGVRREVSDRARGMARITVPAAAGGLEAALYVTRSGRLPDRSWIERQFSAPSAKIEELLAGRPATPQPDRGKLVCVCHDVGEKVLRGAIEQGANSLPKLCEVTRAGTNCGSCRPILAQLLAQVADQEKETVE